MRALKIFSVFIILSILHVSVVRCFKPKNYCEQKYLNQCIENSFSFHVGCSNRTAKIGVPLKLAEYERMKLTNYFNDIRNQIASDKNLTEMYALSWSEEYEYLAQLAIEKLISSESGCYWTKNSKEFPTEITNIKIATNVDKIWIISGSQGTSFEYNTNMQLSEVEFNNSNKLNDLLGEEEKRQIMANPITALYDPSSNLIGCAWTIRHNSTDDFKQIRCAINGRTFFNTSAYISGPRCSKCKTKCSTKYTHLCSSSDKFGISFWLVCFTVFLAFDKLFK